MTPQEIDRIEWAIRHIQTTTDINPCAVWSVEIAVEAMKKQIQVKPILAKGGWRMSDLKKYVIEKEGYSSIIVNLTEREARVIKKFLDWACLDDDFYIELVEEYKADEWGNDGTN